MKHFFLILTVLFSVQFVSAQYNIKATKAKDSFKGIGSQDVIVVKIFDRSAEDINQAWRRTMRWQHRAKINENGLEFHMEDARVREVSDRNIDIYSKPVRNVEGFVEFRVAVYLGGAYLNPSEHPKRHEAMVGYMENFAREQTKEGLEARIKSEENKLSEFETQREVYRQEIVDFREEIAELEQQIQIAKDKIAANERLIEGRNQNIQEQKLEIQRLKTITIE